MLQDAGLYSKLDSPMAAPQKLDIALSMSSKMASGRFPITIHLCNRINATRYTIIEPNKGDLCGHIFDARAYQNLSTAD